MRAKMHSSVDDGSPGSQITASDIEFFKSNGYLFKRGLLDPAELQGCVDHFWQDLPPSVRRDDPSTWTDVHLHDDWFTPTPQGWDRCFARPSDGELVMDVRHNSAGRSRTFHGIGTDEAFLRATAWDPNSLRVIEGLMGGPIQLPQRNRGICALQSHLATTNPDPVAVHVARFRLIRACSVG